MESNYKVYTRYNVVKKEKKKKKELSDDAHVWEWYLCDCGFASVSAQLIQKAWFLTLWDSIWKNLQTPQVMAFLPCVCFPNASGAVVIFTFQIRSGRVSLQLLWVVFAPHHTYVQKYSNNLPSNQFLSLVLINHCTTSDSLWTYFTKHTWSKLRSVNTTKYQCQHLLNLLQLRWKEKKIHSLYMHNSSYFIFYL